MPGAYPLTLPYPTMLFDKLDEFMLEFEEQDKEVEAGVVVDGDAAAYALVWEHGNSRQTKKGPKTTLGINPDGQRAWLSIQAPYGYIRIHQGEYWSYLQEELAKAKFSSPETGVISDELRRVAKRAIRRVADLIRATVPVDTGNLRGDIQTVDPEDYVTLDLAGDVSDVRTMVLHDVG